jgi:hypothetical protein
VGRDEHLGAPADGTMFKAKKIRKIRENRESLKLRWR